MTTLPDVIDSEFLDRSDVFAMNGSTLGVGADIDRWPDQVINPISNGLKYLLFDFNSDYTARSDGNLSPGILAPRQGGVFGDYIYWIAYDAANLPFNVIYDHASERVGKATFSQIQLNNFSPYRPDFTYINGLSFNSFLDMRAKNCQICNCEWDDVQEFCIRIRNNGSFNTIKNNLFQRFPPFSTTADRPCILLSDGLNLSNIIYGNTILNYTDSIQLEDNDDLSTGTSAGTVISNNFMGITSEAQIPVGEMEDGLENIIDIKVAGTEFEPIIIENNVMFGLRQNTASPGYAINIKRFARNIIINNNIFSDLESGIFFNAQYVDNNPANQWLLSETSLLNNSFLEIRDNGADIFPEKAGRVFAGSNVPSSFHNNIIKNCDFLSEIAPNTAAGEWPFDINKSNKLYEPITQGGLTWPERIIDVNGNERIQVPYTQKTVIVSIE